MPTAVSTRVPAAGPPGGSAGSDAPAAAGTSARLDAELVRRGHARSRARASDLVAAGRVTVAGRPARRPSQQVAPDVDLLVTPDAADQWVSRAAHKLLGALDAADRLAPGALDPAGATCLDAGASTGGFTQVLLARGAARVVAVDVGHGQLAPELAADPRVTVREGLNVRDLDPADPDLDPPPTLVVADLSFISLTLVVPALLAVAAPGADLLVMVKPQFEVGRERLGRDGVVTSTEQRVEAVLAVARAAVTGGTGARTAVPDVTTSGPGVGTTAVPDAAEVVAVIPSPLPGSGGNREYFLWLRRGGRVEGDSSVVSSSSPRGGLHLEDARVVGAGPTPDPADSSVGSSADPRGRLHISDPRAAVVVSGDNVVGSSATHRPEHHSAAAVRPAPATYPTRAPLDVLHEAVTTAVGQDRPTLVAPTGGHHEP